jgi:hypothetical protein
MASGYGNKIIVPLNPTEPSGPAWERSRQPGWITLPLSALDHPNVIHRQEIIPGAISHVNIDSRVESDECEDMGPFPEVQPREEHGDFLYTLTGNSSDRRVYRPNPRFRAQVKGEWAEGSAEGPLFTPASWDRAVDRWNSLPRHHGTPDRVGIDLARLGGDEIMAAATWGETGPAVLRNHREVRRRQDEVEEEEYAAQHQIYMGRLVRVPNGEGPEVAERIAHLFRGAEIYMDSSTVGASPYDHLRHVLGVDAYGLQSAETPPEPEIDEPRFENLRAAMYWRFSRLVRHDLIALPPDAKLREEAMNTEVVYSSRTINGNRVDVVRIEPKEKIKRRIGRSPDSLDAAVMSVWEGESTVETWIYAGPG